MENLLNDLIGSVATLIGVAALAIALAEIFSHPTSNGWTDWTNEDRWRHL